jgi:hypothetical protein
MRAPAAAALPALAGDAAARIAAAALTLVSAAGCQLREVTVAAPEDIVVAEVVLQAGATQQLAWVHHTLGNGQLTVPGATVDVSGPDGTTLHFAPAAAQVCVDSSATVTPETAGSCYVARSSPPAIAPGATYSLRVVLPGGGTLTGRTTVPGEFHLTRPGGLAACALRAGTLLPITWTRASGAWLYIAESRIVHVRRALSPGGSDAGMDLVGLSLSASDTTILFPSQFGLFDRANASDAPVLLALQKGLPEGATATIGVAAADRDYVDWVRRGAFNPSGTVQIPSVRGAGTGVFGSVVSHRFDLSSSGTSSLPACGG